MNFVIIALHVYFHNKRRLRTKLTYYTRSAMDFDFVCIHEFSLNGNVLDHEVCDPTLYGLFRHRETTNSKSRDGGSTIIITKSNLNDNFIDKITRSSTQFNYIQ